MEGRMCSLDEAWGKIVVVGSSSVTFLLVAAQYTSGRMLAIQRWAIARG
ncbi:hypothetical protein M8A51_17200 [Schlegelella sp. S2-27]|uniref:Uncharacterized protein n=1 Tax=Caldimonas mangrovi TaxID=2944811 RepID=A0ABT0YRA9_9BURK|nr:hypothetical protein [Caldimonas mangrovi]MCM5681267.1 hypothetical protein [Caldimonas mangrovi]